MNIPSAAALSSPPFGTGMRMFLYTDDAASRRYGYSLSRDASR